MEGGKEERRKAIKEGSRLKGGRKERKNVLQIRFIGAVRRTQNGN
jgi:hypothetical protein